MALFCLIGFPKKLPRLDLFRHLNKALAQKPLHFSTTKCTTKRNDAPVKYSTNKAANVEIAETIGLKPTPSKYPYSKYVIVTSLIVFLIYFCILREENDLDAILSGEQEKTEEQQLFDLQMKLIYCQQNKLPTVAIKAKIEEIKSRRKTEPVFRM